MILPIPDEERNFPDDKIDVVSLDISLGIIPAITGGMDMDRIDIVKMVKVGRFEFRKGLCSCVTVTAVIGADGVSKSDVNDHITMTESTLYKMLTQEQDIWEATEYPDGVQLRQIGIELFIYYAINGITI
jgi:hypothetical protein